MPISGEEWKHSNGEQLQPQQAKRFAVQKSRILISCSLSEHPIETKIHEVSPMGDYIKIENNWMGMGMAHWLSIMDVQLLCELRQPYLNSK